MWWGVNCVDLKLSGVCGVLLYLYDMYLGLNCGRALQQDHTDINALLVLVKGGRGSGHSLSNRQ